jgi:hypothetical protein
LSHAFPFVSALGGYQDLWFVTALGGYEAFWRSNWWILRCTGRLKLASSSLHVALFDLPEIPLYGL